MIAIPKSEFQERIIRVQAEMERERIDMLVVYGDEYRKENLYRQHDRRTVPSGGNTAVVP